MNETQKTQLFAVHVGCVFAICLCFALAELTSLNTVMLVTIEGVKAPLLSRALEAAGFFLWGKLGFRPAQVITDRMLQAMDPAKIEQIMSQRPPPLPPRAPGNT